MEDEPGLKWEDRHALAMLSTSHAWLTITEMWLVGLNVTCYLILID